MFAKDWLQMYLKNIVIMVATAGALFFTASCSDEVVAAVEAPKMPPKSVRLEDLVHRDGLYVTESGKPFTGPVRIHAHGFNVRCAEERAEKYGIKIADLKRMDDEDQSDERVLARLTDCMGGEGELIAGKKHGVWARFAEHGKMLSMQTYDNGLLEGPARLFYLKPAEQIREEKIFKAGKMEGPHTKFAVDGTVTSIVTYKGGVLQEARMDGLDRAWPEELDAVILDRDKTIGLGFI